MHLGKLDPLAIYPRWSCALRFLRVLPSVWVVAGCVGVLLAMSACGSPNQADTGPVEQLDLALQGAGGSPGGTGGPPVGTGGGGPIPFPSNIAFLGVATQSVLDPTAPAPFGGEASRAIDSNFDGNFGNGSVTHSSCMNEAWWQLDLKEIRGIDEVGIWNRTDCCGDRLKNFWVLVSDVPFLQTDLNATIAQPGVTGLFVGAPANQFALSFSRSGRYIRVQLSENNCLSLAEVRVLGEPKTVTAGIVEQSSTAFGGTADRATDLNLNGDYFASPPSVTHTDNIENEPFWQADIGFDNEDIGHVGVWNRTDCCSDRLSDFWVFVSRSPFTHRSIADVRALEPNLLLAQHVIGPGSTTNSTWVTVNRRGGRYVRVQLAGKNYLSLAEVGVFTTHLF